MTGVFDATFLSEIRVTLHEHRNFTASMSNSQTAGRMAASSWTCLPYRASRDEQMHEQS